MGIENFGGQPEQQKQNPTAVELNNLSTEMQPKNSVDMNRRNFLNKAIETIGAVAIVGGVTVLDSKPAQASEKPATEHELEAWENTYTLEIEKNLGTLLVEVEELKATNPEVAAELEKTLIPAVKTVMNKTGEIQTSVSWGAYSGTLGLVHKAVEVEVDVPAFLECDSTEFNKFSHKKTALITKVLVLWYMNKYFLKNTLYLVDKDKFSLYGVTSVKTDYLDDVLDPLFRHIENQAEREKLELASSN